ncbi:ATP-binding cassette domain-containing protein [soil metagenome]
MSLELSARVKARGFDLEFAMAPGEHVAILGPNGAGKSTTLSVLAGLLKPDDGRVVLDDRVLADVGRGTSAKWVPPHDRGIALMAQDPLLFPFLTVLENVAFGPRSAGVSKAAAREVARHWLSEVEASDLAARKPHELSGGQAQRVALARALAADPKLLLLDEPLSALDVGTAPLMRQVLRRVLAGRSAIIVTHEILDALLLADRVIVIDDGSIVESGPTAEVLARPRSAFTARLAGLNMVVGAASGTAVRGEAGLVVEGAARGDVVQGQQAVAVFRPHAVSVFVQPPAGSPRNQIAVTVTELEPRDGNVRVRAGELSADITAAAAADLDLAPGVRAYFSVKANQVTIYPL